ncbi:MAG: hypothetical protein NT067_07170 [Candidatus Diapherotrites archaeon]|nr:hypothetical protein [Candidatus Diapherotrites archaeon]
MNKTVFLTLKFSELDIREYVGKRFGLALLLFVAITAFALLSLAANIPSPGEFLRYKELLYEDAGAGMLYLLFFAGMMMAMTAFNRVILELTSIKDIEALLPLPVRPESILFARTFASTLLLGIFGIILLPFAAVIFYLLNLNFLGLALGAALLFSWMFFLAALINAAALGLFAVFGKTRVKNIWPYFALLFGFAFYFMAYAQNGPGLAVNLPVLSELGLAILSNSFGFDLPGVLLVGIASAGLFWLAWLACRLSSRQYFSSLEKAEILSSESRGGKRAREFSLLNPEFSAFVQKDLIEFRRNTQLKANFFVPLAVTAVLVLSPGLTSAGAMGKSSQDVQLPGLLEKSTATIYAIVLAAGVSALSITLLSAQIDGKRFWLALSTPFRPENLLLAKIFLWSAPPIAVSLIAFAVMSFVYPQPPAATALIFAGTVILSSLLSFFSVGLSYFFFDSEREPYTKKFQGNYTPAPKAIFTGMGLLMGLFILAALLAFIASPRAPSIKVAALLYFAELAIIGFILYLNALRKIRELHKGAVGKV